LELRSEEARFTSLFGGNGGSVSSENIGVVEPALENANDPFDGVRMAEAGREDGVWLESRDVAMLPDKRRSQDCGLVLGVPSRAGISSSRCIVLSNPMLALGVRLRFSPVRALPDEKLLPYPVSCADREA